MPLQPMPLKLDNSVSLIIDLATCWAICLIISNNIGAIASLGAGVRASAAASTNMPERTILLTIAYLLGISWA